MATCVERGGAGRKVCADGTGFGEGRSVGSDIWTGGVGGSGVYGIGRISRVDLMWGHRQGAVHM